MDRDCFAVLDQPRRPWLDPEQLKHKYHELARSGHPDAGHPLGVVNDAYRILSDPKLRLRHLLELEGDGSAADVNELPTDLTDLFMETAALVRDADSLLSRKNRSTTTLATSLLQSEAATITERANGLLKTLDQLHHAATQDLKRTDQIWTSDRAKAAIEVRRLIQRFAYLDRWIDQLREKQFQLAS